MFDTDLDFNLRLGTGDDQPRSGVRVAAADHDAKRGRRDRSVVCHGGNATHPESALTCLSMSERLDVWMDRYVLAWSSNETEHIEELFTEDAVYDPQTADGEWEGRDEIIARWQEIDDSEDNWDFEWQPIVETDDLAVIQGRTNYFDPPISYRNLFIIRFAEDGRCSDFTEWYIEEED